MLFCASALCALAAVLLHHFPWLDASVRSAVTASMDDLTADGTRRPTLPAPPTAPARVRVPAIGVDADVLPLGPDATEAPGCEDATKVGWYPPGDRPGSPDAAVLVGRRDAVFAHLDRLVPGDRVETLGKDGRSVRFRVTSVDAYRPRSFPARHVRRPVRDARLRLITCGGALDGDGRGDPTVSVGAARERVRN